MKVKETVKQILTKQVNKRYDRQLARRKISYDTWVREQEAGEQILDTCVLSGDGKRCAVDERSADTAGAEWDAKSDGMREYVLFRQRRGSLSKYAYQWLDAMFAAHPEAMIVYGDEDLQRSEGVRENPWYKPCWSPDSYLSGFYPGSVVAVRKGCFDQIKADSQTLFCKPEEIRPILRTCIELAGGFNKNCRTILHCSHILFHVTEEEVWQDYLSSKEIIAKEKVSKEVTNVSEVKDQISVIIPSKDNPRILANCLRSLEAIPDLDVVVVDNGSSEENQIKVRELTKGMTYLYHPMEFNFSKMCNMGADVAKGRFLLFLNDDIEACGQEWIVAMREKAAMPYEGAVGLKLYYPDSIRIQHAGITSLPVGPVHKMQFAQDEQSIYFDRNQGTVNCLAVTGACLMIEKDKFREVGGLKEALPVAYNDVELCFSLYEAGYHNVVLNQYHAYHYESLSRGDDVSPEKMGRLQQERELLYQLHPAFRKEDPYYPEGLTRDGLDSRIVPGYVNAGNTVQEAAPEGVSLKEGQIREDPCLFLGLEVSSPEEIKGYGVVLGDNNACYDRYVILQNAAGETWQIPAEPQYRQDLEENMADQEKVALCGFHIHFSKEALQKLKREPYRIGVLAVHKWNRGKLLNWSSRYFTL